MPFLHACETGSQLWLSGTLDGRAFGPVTVDGRLYRSGEEGAADAFLSSFEPYFPRCTSYADLSKMPGIQARPGESRH